MLLLVLVALGFGSQHVATTGTPKAFPFHVDVTCGTSLYALPIPKINPLSFCHLVPVTDSVASHAVYFSIRKL